MANIPVIAEINTLLDANDVAIAKAALGVLGAAVKGIGDIVNADISATAAINVSKLSSSSASAGLVLTSTGGTAAPTFQSVAGTGDVVGTTASIENQVPRFGAGTTGKVIKNSLVTVSDVGAITTPQSTASVIPFYHADQSTFPSATTYHGAIAHSHNDAAMYYAHGGSWVKMLAANTPVTVAQGGTGTATPSLVQGSNVTITGAWPNQTITAASGGTPADGSITTAKLANGAVTFAKTDGILERNTSLAGLRKSVKQSFEGPTSPLSMIFIGDSFTATGSLWDYRPITRVVGFFKAQPLSGGGDSGTSTISNSSMPNGSCFRIIDGGNLTAGYGTTGLQGNASHIYYTLLPGTGTAQLQYKKGAGAWINVGGVSSIDTTTITNVLIGSLALPDTSSNYAVRVTATGGNVDGFIGMGLNGPGLTIINFATDGIAIEQTASIPEVVWKAMIAGYRTSVSAMQIVHVGYADYRFTLVATSAWPTKGVEGWGVSSPAQTLYDWSVAQNADIDWLVVGPHQVNTANTDPADALPDAAFAAIGIGSNVNIRTIDGSRAQREFAVRNNMAWADSIYLTDYASGNPIGLYGDSVHFSAMGQNLKRNNVLRETNLGDILNRANIGGVPLGEMGLVPTLNRGLGAGIAAIQRDVGGKTLAPILAAIFRAGDSVNTEQAGMEFAFVSTNLARIRSYSAGGVNNYGVDFTYNGVGAVIRPNITGSSQNGTNSLPWETTFTQGLVFPPVAQTATTAAVSTVYVTTALTTTAPAQAITLANGVAGQIKIITHVATSGSGTAVLTPATKTGYTTITFTSVGDTVTLQYHTTIGWIISSIRGAVAA